MGKNIPSGNSGGKRRFSAKGAARGGRHTLSAPGAARSPHPGRDAISPNRRRGFADGQRPYDYSFYEAEAATPEYMDRLFREHGFPVTQKQLRMFWTYYDLLRRHNASLDLTRIMGIEATVLKHFIDSAIILRWIEPSGPVLDIGSGPGFPGFPLAIMRPDISFILAESRGKRVGFLEEAKSALGVGNVEIFPHSIREDSDIGDEQGKPVGDIVTRALETIGPTLSRILPFVRTGARIVFMKGPGCDDEIAEAMARYRNVYELEHDIRYDLPNTDQHRRLVIFRKAIRM